MRRTHKTIHERTINSTTNCQNMSCDHLSQQQQQQSMNELCLLVMPATRNELSKRHWNKCFPTVFWPPWVILTFLPNSNQPTCVFHFINQQSWVTGSVYPADVLKLLHDGQMDGQMT